MSLPTASAGLHVRYEKAGLILDALPIPWNADAVIVEANVRLPAKTPHRKEDFTLRIGTKGSTVHAELIAAPTKGKPLRVFFRIPAPTETCEADVRWREHALGQVELPILAQAVFEQGFMLEMATVHVVLGSRTVACRSFVTTQAKGLFASCVVKSVGPLAALHEMGLHVDVRRADGDLVASTSVPFTSEQLRQRQTLVSVHLPRPRAVGTYDISWRLGTQLLHAQRLRAVSKKTLLRSLRVSATRFLLIKTDGTIETVRALPTRDGQLALDGIVEVAPVFFVCSSEVGMAGMAMFTMRAQVAGRLQGGESEEVVTDGPTPIVLSRLSAETLSSIEYFPLECGDRVLGNLPILPAPATDFTAEGGFASLDDYLWSPAAEEQLNERLGKLLDGE